MSPGGVRLRDCCVVADGQDPLFEVQAADFFAPKCLGLLRSPAGASSLATGLCVACNCGVSIEI
jgi:hypothetical protein